MIYLMYFFFLKILNMKTKHIKKVQNFPQLEASTRHVPFGICKYYIHLVTYNLWEGCEGYFFVLVHILRIL